MSGFLRRAYTVFAPFYDRMVAAQLARARAQSLAALPRQPGRRVLLSGVGTGLDFPFLPAGNRYVAVDLTAAMLKRARRGRGALDAEFAQADGRRLPFPDGAFDHAVLHLVLTVAPEPVRFLGETARVVKPGGTVLVLDKFMRRGEALPLAFSLNPLRRGLVTRLTDIFEDILAEVPGLTVRRDAPVLPTGQFRTIELVKAPAEARPPGARGASAARIAAQD